jgi:hypothetical protein
MSRRHALVGVAVRVSLLARLGRYPRQGTWPPAGGEPGRLQLRSRDPRRDQASGNRPLPPRSRLRPHPRRSAGDRRLLRRGIHTPGRLAERAARRQAPGRSVRGTHRQHRRAARDSRAGYRRQDPDRHGASCQGRPRARLDRAARHLQAVPGDALRRPPGSHQDAGREPSPRDRDGAASSLRRLATQVQADAVPGRSPPKRSRCSPTTPATSSSAWGPVQPDEASVARWAGRRAHHWRHSRQVATPGTRRASE